jgi:hypothetical protein
MPSAVIKSIAYDPATETLSVTYVSEVTYDYKNVPNSVYREMKSMRNKGTYLNFHIKGKYDYEKNG